MCGLEDEVNPNEYNNWNTVCCFGMCRKVEIQWLDGPMKNGHTNRWVICHTKHLQQWVIRLETNETFIFQVPRLNTETNQYILHDFQSLNDHGSAFRITRYTPVCIQFNVCAGTLHLTTNCVVYETNTNKYLLNNIQIDAVRSLC